MGKPPYNVPPQPLNYLLREDDLAGLKQLLLHADHPKLAVTGRSLRVGVNGMGGIGKTVLAAAVARDAEVNSAFVDGVYWLSISQQPNLTTRQADLYNAISGENRDFDDYKQGLAELNRVMADKACLVILDDVWSLDDAKAFDLQSPRSRILMTTRDRNVASRFYAEIHNIDILSPSQALSLIAQWTEQTVEKLPLIARQICKECGYLPLALAMIGATIKRLPDSWEAILDRLQRVALLKFETGFLDYEYPNLFRALEVSIEHLPEQLKEHYNDFAIFPEDIAVPLSVFDVLWKSAGFNHQDVIEVLDDLCSRSLITGSKAAGYYQHDLQRNYILFSNDSRKKSLHQKLISAYRKICQDNWVEGPNDHYFFQFLPYHLDQAGDYQTLVKLLLNYEWIERKLDFTNVSEVLSDYRLPGSQNPALRPIHGMLKLSSPTLAKDKDQLPGQLLARLDGTKNPAYQELLDKAKNWRKKAWLRPETASLLSWSSDNTLRMWDLTTAQPLAVLEGHTDSVEGALLLPNDRVLSWSSDHTLRLWDLTIAQPLAVLEGHTDMVWGALLLSDGRVLSWSNDHTLRLWNLLTIQPAAARERHTDWVYDALLVPDGRVLSWSRDNTLRLWDPTTAQPLAVLEGHTDGVMGALPLPDGRILSWSWDHTLRLWDLTNPQPLAVLEGHTDSVLGALLLPDGRVLSWSLDNTLRLWDLTTAQPLAILEGHTSWVNGALLLLDGCALSWSNDRTLRLWDLTAVQPLAVLEGHTDSVDGALLLPDGRALSWSVDSTLRLWNLSTSQSSAVLEGHTEIVWDVLLLPDSRALSSSRDSTLRLWELTTGQSVAILEGHTDLVFGAFILPNGHALSWSMDSTLRLWNLTTSQSVAVLEGHTGSVWGALLLPNDRVLSWANDNTICIWNLHDSICQAVFTADAPITTCLVITEQNRVLAGDGRGGFHFLSIIDPSNSRS